MDKPRIFGRGRSSLNWLAARRGLRRRTRGPRVMTSAVLGPSHLVPVVVMGAQKHKNTRRPVPSSFDKESQVLYVVVPFVKGHVVVVDRNVAPAAGAAAPVAICGVSTGTKRH